jgi:hypothetical protein
LTTAGAAALTTGAKDKVAWAGLVGTTRVMGLVSTGGTCATAAPATANPTPNITVLRIDRPA